MILKSPQPIDSKVRSRICGNDRGWVFTPKHFQDIGSSDVSFWSKPLNINYGRAGGIRTHESFPYYLKSMSCLILLDSGNRGNL